VERLAASFIEILGNLVTHCQSATAGRLIARDFPEAGLSQSELDGLVEELSGDGSREPA
jgi:hypothetical protein